MNDLIYDIDKSGIQDVLDHLMEMDEEFIPPLHTYVVITDYAKKIVAQATRFEVWRRNELKGLAAGYVNRADCYISNFSISHDIRGDRIGSKLLEYVVHYCRSNEVYKILLEVRKENKKAIAFYEREGFLIQESKLNSFIYLKSL